MMTISKEDYLKAIAEAEAEGQTVIPATLAHWLSVTRPAVTFALKRLTKDGLVSIKRDGHIHLTPQGREIAERTIVRHHLIERMLTEVFGMAWRREQPQFVISASSVSKTSPSASSPPVWHHGISTRSWRSSSSATN